MEKVKTGISKMTQPTELPQQRPISLNDLYSVERLDGFSRIEIVDSEWYLTETDYYRQPDFRASLVQTKLLVMLSTHARMKQLGKVVSGSLGFVLEGNDKDIKLLRRSDLAFIDRDRLATNHFEPFYSAPDLSVYILNEKITRGMTKRIKDFLKHGTQQVWLVSVDQEQIVHINPDMTFRKFGPKNTIRCDTILPGFEVKVSKIFES